MTQEDAYDLKITTRGSDAFEKLVGTVMSEGGKIDAFHTQEPSLEDVFLTVTGKDMRDSASNKNASPMFDHHGDAPKSRAR